MLDSRAIQKAMQEQDRVTLEFAALNGHAWTHTVQPEDIQLALDNAMAAHDDLERVSILRYDGPQNIYLVE